jgi:hypothetical protein
MARNFHINYLMERLSSTTVISKRGGLEARTKLKGM